MVALKILHKMHQQNGAGHKHLRDALPMTLIRQTPDNAPWAVVARSVYWSRDVALTTWRDQVVAGHPSYLQDSVARMSPRNFIRFLGRQDFLDHWPSIREFLKPGVRGLSSLDATWSFMKTGTFNMPPEAALASWPGRSKEVYDAIVQHQGASIYKVSTLSGVPYRRVHDHVGKMEDMALVRSFLDRTGPRPRRRLYTMKSAVREQVVERPGLS